MTGITSKANYGIQIILELAKYYNKSLLQINDISKAKNIPKSYLIQLLNKLKNTKIVESYRGNNGGYRLAKSPSELTLLTIIETLDGKLDLFKLYTKNDAVKSIFNTASAEIKKSLSVSIEDILIHQDKIEKNSMYYI